MPVLSEHAPPDRACDEPRVDQRFLRSSRLLRRSEFVRVQTQGRRVHTSHFVILLSRVQRPTQSGPRLGVTVGRRVGCAVRRNRIKRLVREVFRRNRELFPVDCDVVLVARSGADGLDYASVLAELLRARASIERAHNQLLASPEKNAP
jgi:ribonuclease P protein component